MIKMVKKKVIKNNLSDDDLINQIHMLEKSHIDTMQNTYTCSVHNNTLFCDGDRWFCPICTPKELKD